MDYEWPTAAIRSKLWFPPTCNTPSKVPIWNALDRWTPNGEAMRIRDNAFQAMQLRMLELDCKVMIGSSQCSSTTSSMSAQPTTYSNGQFLYSMGSSQEMGLNNIQNVYTNRPREIGIRFTQSW